MYLSTVTVTINLGINWPGRSITYLISKPIILLHWPLFHLHCFCVYLVRPSLAFKSLPILVLYALSRKRLAVRISRTNWQISLEHATESWLFVQMHMVNERYNQTGDRGVDSWNRRSDWLVKGWGHSPSFVRGGGTHIQCIYFLVPYLGSRWYFGV